MADNAIQAAEASGETLEILKELQAEGHEVQGLEAPEKVQEEPQEPKKANEAPIEPTEKVEVPEPEKEKTKTERKPLYVPVGKHNEERHKRQEAEERAAKAAREAEELRAQIAALSSKSASQGQDDVREAASKLAEEHGLDAEFVAKFAETVVNMAEKRNSLPKDIAQKLASFEALQARAEAEAQQRAQEKAFEQEFTSVIKEFPELADKKDDLKGLAFTEGNLNTSLRRLALEYVHDNPTIKGRKTAESSYRSKGPSEVLDFEAVDEATLKGLEGEKLDQYIAWLTKKK